MFKGHAGHDERHPDDYEMHVPDLKGNEYLYGLDSQVRHKVFNQINLIKENKIDNYSILCFLKNRLNLFVNMYPKM